MGIFGNITNAPSLIKTLATPDQTAARGMGINPNSVVGQGAGIHDQLIHPIENYQSQQMNSKGPDAPSESPNVGRVLTAQQKNASDFRSNIPTMENQLFSQVQQRGAAQLGGELQGVRESSSRRGLLYGGLNQGKEQAARANMSEALSKARSGINAGVENAANTLDAQAVNTALGVQKSRQSIQDDIYSQAMNNMYSTMGAFGMGIGSLGQFGGLLAGG